MHNILSGNMGGIYFLDFLLFALILTDCQKNYIEKKVEIFSQDFMYIIIGPVATFQWSKSSIWLLNVLGSIKPQMIWASHASSNNSNLWTFQKKFNLYDLNNLHFIHQNNVCRSYLMLWKISFLKYLNLYFSEIVI